MPVFLQVLILSAIWGSSFLFMRLAAPAFGPVPLVLFRTALAALCLSPWLLRSDYRTLFRRHAGALLFVGVMNSAVPFSLLSFAMLSLEAGFTSLINATTPLFTALVGWAWYRFPLRRLQVLGLALGFAGVLVLAWGRMSFKPGGSGWAVLAGLAACVCYGIAAHYARRHLVGVPAPVVTMGSMAGAAISLVPLGWWEWPAMTPSPTAWGCALALGVACTALAYFIYYSILANAGPTTATAVTFVVPAFAVLWGTLFLHESLTLRVLGGMGVTLLGTAFTTGLIGSDSKR